MNLDPLDIEINENNFRVDGELFDLVAFNHWRQTQEYDGRADHSPDQDYKEIKAWHEDALEMGEEEVVQGARMMSFLHDFFQSMSMFGYPDQFLLSAFTTQKIFSWTRYLRGFDEWPPESSYQLQRLKRMKKYDENREPRSVS